VKRTSQNKFFGFLFGAFFLFSGFNLLSQNDFKEPLLLTSDSYRIYPSDVSQSEVFITKSPLDENILFTSCNTLTFIPFFISEGVYTTTNGGNNWYGSDTCKGEPLAFHGGDPGIAIDKNGMFVLTRLGRSPFVGLYSHYSLDNGKTWSAQEVISTDDLERAAVASDAVSTSSFSGRTYATWVKFAQPFPMMFSFTDDGAKNWSEPSQINNPFQRCAGGDVAIGPEGEVYVCWAGVTDVSPFKETFVGFASSGNGGEQWDVTEEAFEMNGITGILPNKENIRVNGLPGIAVDTTDGDRRGWIYIVTGQKNLSPAGNDPDIILNRSADGGKTWSPAIRVNQDELNNGKTQYFPSVNVDKFGAVNVMYFDDRFTTNDSTGVMLSRSLDGGDTWTEYLVSDHNYKPEPIGGLGQGYQGDNIDLTSTNSEIWPVWMDNSTGIYQIWTAPISFESLDGFYENQTEKNVLRLEQNFPNPFTRETTISYQLTKHGRVTLTILDGFGKTVSILVDEKQKPGSYHLVVNSENLGNNLKEGIYFCRLQQGAMTVTKKMTLVK
jgi:hypothetical protein